MEGKVVANGVVEIVSAVPLIWSEESKLAGNAKNVFQIIRAYVFKK